MQEIRVPTAGDLWMQHEAPIYSLEPRAVAGCEPSCFPALSDPISLAARRCMLGREGIIKNGRETIPPKN